MKIEITLKRGAIAFVLLLALFGSGFGTGLRIGYVRWYTPPPAPRIGQVAELYVEEVTDGDTLKVRCGEKICKVRLMGIDTPETVDRRKPIQYCGPEAKELTKKLQGQTLKFQFLLPDEPNVKRDKYDRLLAYVYTADGKLFNEQLVALGMAREYKYRETYEMRPRFLQAQENAKQKKLGVWSESACARQEAKQ